MKVTRFVRPYGKFFTLGSAAKLVEAMLELYLPILMAQIIDIGIPSGDKEFILKTGGKLLLFALAGFACAVTCQYLAAITSQGTGTLIRSAMMKHISSFSYRELDRFRTSTLITRMTSDINYVQQAVAMTMRLVTRAPFICIGAVIMSAFISLRLTVIFAVIIPILGLLLVFFLSYTAPKYRLVQQKLDQFGLIVRENLSGVRVVRAFARTKQEGSRANRAADELCGSFVRVSSLSALMNPATSIVLNLGIIALLYFGAYQVFDGAIPQGDLLALTTYSTKILYALIVIANLVVLFTKASASAVRISEVLETAPSLEGAVSSPSPSASVHAPIISFQDVSFSYSGREDAITDLSFSVEKGETLGIVGVTGSGKSTLGHLIQRFYQPDKGTISLQGIPVESYPEQELRRMIGVVPQSNVLFTGTILENIRWGKDNATEDEVRAALRTAQCWDFVSTLPEGIHSPIREGGKNLSGGQRQRLAIARALVKRPKILILDDSLSALDYQTDLRLRKAIKRDLEGTTVIIISQRLSSVAGAEKILVLEDGQIENMGTHAYLLENCTTYREIYQSQSGSEIGTGGTAHA